MADLYEVLLVDGGHPLARRLARRRRQRDRRAAARPGHACRCSAAGPASSTTRRSTGLELLDDLPDEIDLDLGGWLSQGMPLPPTAEVSELWHLLYDDPVAGRALSGELLGEAYDDLVEEAPDWFADPRAGRPHGARRRRLAPARCAVADPRDARATDPQPRCLAGATVLLQIGYPLTRRRRPRPR